MEILNMYAVSIRASKYMKQKMDRLQWIKTYFEDFNMSLYDW